MEINALQSALSKLGSFLLALILAIIVWAVAISEENPSVRKLFPESIPIEIINKAPNVVVFGDVIDRVRLTIQAPQSSWDNLRRESFQAWVDLEGLSPDMYDMKVQVKCSDEAVKIWEIKPAKISIRLEELKEKMAEVRPNIADSAPLGYIYRTPTVTPTQAKVSGPASLVDQVVTVVADIYLQNAKSTVEKNITLIARDLQGEAVKDVEIDPPRAKVRVPIDQRLGYKDVSVRVILEGKIASGYRISNVSIDPSIVTVVGNPSAISNIPGYLETAPIDVSGASADIVERVTLILTEGVSLLSGQQGVMVEVKVTPLESGLTVQRKLTIEGLGLGLAAKPSPEMVDVILSGPMPRLDTLKPEEVQVILDLFDLGIGTHIVTPRVISPEGIRAESILPETIEVEITRLPTPTPADMPTLTPIPSPTRPSLGTRIRD